MMKILTALLVLTLSACGKAPAGSLPILSAMTLLQPALESCHTLENWNGQESLGFMNKSTMVLFVQDRVSQMDLAKSEVTPIADQDILVGTFCTIKIKNEMVSEVIYPEAPSQVCGPGIFQVPCPQTPTEPMPWPPTHP